jgi:ketol-acid reductoisomerase
LFNQRFRLFEFNRLSFSCSDIFNGHFFITTNFGLLSYYSLNTLLGLVAAGIKEESAYYESLHETPLIANTIARKKLFEMNRIISDTAEYGCYLFDHAAKPLLADFMKGIKSDVIGAGLANKDQGVDNKQLIDVNEIIRYHPVEMIGYELRASMTAMTKIV